MTKQSLIPSAIANMKATMNKLLDTNGDGTVDMKDVKERSAAVASEVKEKTVTYITAALGLVAGLAWNEAIKAAIEIYVPLGADSVAAKFVYALVMTLLLVGMSMILVRLAKKTSEEKEAEKK